MIHATAENCLNKSLIRKLYVRPTNLVAAFHTTGAGYVAALKMSTEREEFFRAQKTSSVCKGSRSLRYLGFHGIPGDDSQFLITLIVSCLVALH